MDKRQLFAIIGCFVLFVGVFAPLLSVPVMGSMNYFQNGKGDGSIVLALAALSIPAVLGRKYKLLWITGLATLGMVGFTFLTFQDRMSAMKTEMAKDLEGNPFRGLADLAVQSIQMQWGWAVLLAGAVMLLIAAGLRDESTGQREHNPNNTNNPAGTPRSTKAVTSKPIALSPSVALRRKNLSTVLLLILLIAPVAILVGLLALPLDRLQRIADFTHEVKTNLDQSDTEASDQKVSPISWANYLRDCGSDSQRVNRAEAQDRFRTNYAGKVVRWEGIAESPRENTGLLGEDDYTIAIQMNPHDCDLGDRLGDVDIRLIVPKRLKKSVLAIQSGDSVAFTGVLESQGDGLFPHVIQVTELLSKDELLAEISKARWYPKRKAPTTIAAEVTFNDKRFDGAQYVFQNGGISAWSNVCCVLWAENALWEARCKRIELNGSWSVSASDFKDSKGNRLKRPREKAAAIYIFCDQGRWGWVYDETNPPPSRLESADTYSSQR